jgi:hypothetical protein
LGSLRFAAYTGQTVESAEAHAGMDKCIVVLSTQSPTSKTHRENETTERVQKGEYGPWRMDVLHTLNIRFTENGFPILIYSKS